jgi:glycosyltransferase involved in cell wall biosynthesis
VKINYIGDFLAPSGYARSIRSCIRALVTAGVQVAGQMHKHDHTQLDFSRDPFFGKGQPGDVSKILGDRARCKIKVWHETPEFYEPDPMQYNIAHLLWETDRIVDYDLGGNPRYNWVSQLNKMDEIWTPAAFEASVFRACGVTVPICVFPYPIDIEQYSPGEAEGQWITGLEENNPMIFLSVFQWTKRKNPNDLILAWTREFHNHDDVILMIKTYRSDFNDPTTIPNTIRELRTRYKIPDLVRNVGPITLLVDETDMPDMYRLSDVLVSPSYGEGWGLPCQEAMACGKPVIYTDASSMPEFCVGWPVKCTPEPVSGMTHIPWYNSLQNWWKVEVEDLRRAFREAYNAWKSGEIVDRGKEARQVVVENHTFEVVGQAMRQRLERIGQHVDGLASRADLATGPSVWVDPAADVHDTPAG